MIAMYNHDDEKYLIGALLQDADLQRELPGLPDDLMHDPQHEIILQAMKTMQADKQPIEALSVGNHISAGQHGTDPAVTVYLLECFRYCPTTANIRHYIAELKQLRALRTAYRMANTFCHRLTEGEALDVCVDELRNQLREANQPKGRIVRMDRVAACAYDYVEKRAEGAMIGLSTYFPDYDRFTGGLFGGELTVIGARPAVGKSAFGMEIALNVARHGKRVLVCSREMNELQYGIRLASNLSGLNGMQLKNGEIGDNQWEPLNEALNEMAKLPIAFSFDAYTVEDLRSVVQHELDAAGVDLLVVDYLQLMSTQKKSEKRYLEVGAVSRGLKTMALDFNIPVIALAQVGRQSVGKSAPGGARAATCPVMSDLRESGNIEQDADVIAFLHRPEAESDPDMIERDQGTRKALEARGRQYLILKFDKQRMGPRGSFGMAFDPSRMQFTCLDRRNGG